MCLQCSTCFTLFGWIYMGLFPSSFSVYSYVSCVQWLIILHSLSISCSFLINFKQLKKFCMRLTSPYLNSNGDLSKISGMTCRSNPCSYVIELDSLHLIDKKIPSHFLVYLLIPNSIKPCTEFGNFLQQIMRLL